MPKWKWLLTPVLFAMVAAVIANVGISRYVLDQATKNIRDVLLSHRGVHLYVQETMHPEFYRALERGDIKTDYYSPEILSSSFTVRVLHGYYSEERQKAGLPPVYYKLAAQNPRNPVNKADEAEEALLRYFRDHPEETEYRAVEEIDGVKQLVVAMPFLRNEKRCLVCHGQRADAPEGLQARYANMGGFGEKEGELRAIESLRVPLEEERSTVLVVTLAVLAGFGALGLLFVFNRTLSGQVHAKTEELGAREQTFRKLLNAAEAAPFEYIPGEDRYTFMGEQIRNILGIDPSEFRCFSDWDRFIHPDDKDTELQACIEATIRCEDHGCRMRLVRPDGRSIIIHMNVNIIEEEGEAVKAVGFIHDVTDLGRGEALSQARITVAKAAAEMDLDGLIRVLLDESEQLTESRIGFLHFVHEDQKTLLLQQWSTRTTKICQASGKGELYPLAHAGVWADSLRTGEVLIHNDYAGLPNRRGLPEGHAPLERELVVPLKHAGKIVVLIGVGNKKVPYDGSDVLALERLGEFAVEIILRKRAEQSSEKIQAQLVQAQKVEAIGRLAGGVAHDFNNMLAVILGHSDLLLERTDLDKTTREGLEEIQSAAQRSSAITKQLLAFARKQIASPKVLDLNEAVDGMLKMLRRLIGEDIDLVWRPRSGIGRVFIDPTQVDQILANLATNARDAIEGVGKVTVETGEAEFDEEYCKVHLDFMPGRYVLLAVSDSGHGIQREKMTNIFEPFFTTKKEGEGTGLGLATVFGIVKQNNGFINVYSEPGQGATFKIYLPVHDAEETVGEEAERPVRELRGGETILLVEDEASVLKLGVKILRSYGYSVLEAKNPEEAIRLACSHSDGIDLLITDVVMPGMNGKELSEKLAVSRPEMKCLYVSGYTANVIVHRGILKEGVNFVPKPFAPLELATKVREVLDEGTS